MKTLLLLPLLILGSCTQVIKLIDEDYSRQLNPDNETKIIFSHNINGETHPCGCRNFPLGGFPQVYGHIENEKKNSNLIYVDSGDTFFSNTVVPEILKDSATFTAQNIAQGLDKIGLNFMTPGDQDFALGEDFLIKTSNAVKFDFLITNSSKKMKIKHKKKIILKNKNKYLVFLGILNPTLLNLNHRELFLDPIEVLKTTILDIKKEFQGKELQFILLSHSGMEFDRKLASQIKEFSWIIGAHSQSYLTFSEEIGKTQIVQVLSKNHYLGKIEILTGAKGKYSTLETREESQNLISPNPMISWLDQYKSKLDKILVEEQNKHFNTEENTNQPYKTYQSCLECHQDQGEFWQGTSHSLAMVTLHKAKAANNSSCIECHSLGYKDPKGFIVPKHIVKSSKKDFNHQSYWNEVLQDYKQVQSIRNLSTKKRKELSKKWIKIDSVQKVEQNFSNVQCLNCHTRADDHPFSVDEKQTLAQYQNKCISCHTKDQSPEWYNKDAKGLATSINESYFSQKLKEISCPKINNE